jgi:hypothetical protein
MGSMDTDSWVSCHILISNVSKGLFSNNTPFHIWDNDGVNSETMPMEVSFLDLSSSEQLLSPFHELSGCHQNKKVELDMLETLQKNRDPEAMVKRMKV